MLASTTGDIKSGFQVLWGGSHLWSGMWAWAIEEACVWRKTELTTVGNVEVKTTRSVCVEGCLNLAISPNGQFYKRVLSMHPLPLPTSSLDCRSPRPFVFVRPPRFVLAWGKNYLHCQCRYNFKAFIHLALWPFSPFMFTPAHMWEGASTSSCNSFQPLHPIKQL